MKAKCVMAAALCLVLVLSPGAARSQQSMGDEGAELDLVFNVIRQSLKEAQTNNVPGFPPLKDVSISLQVVSSVVASAGINLYVFTIGTKYTNETASTIKLTMTPPATKAGTLSGATDKLKLALARAINLAKIGVMNGNREQPLLRMSNIDIELKFAVKVEGSGGVKVELLPLGLEGTGKLERNKIHTVALKFGT
jgi:hypothetical protein